jgi:hypothetical protein
MAALAPMPRGQREHGRHGESGSLLQLPQRIAHVLHQGCDHCSLLEDRLGRGVCAMGMRRVSQTRNLRISVASSLPHPGAAKMLKQREVS